MIEEKKRREKRAAKTRRRKGGTKNAGAFQPAAAGFAFQTAVSNRRRGCRRKVAETGNQPGTKRRTIDREVCTLALPSNLLWRTTCARCFHAPITHRPARWLALAILLLSLLPATALAHPAAAPAA